MTTLIVAVVVETILLLVFLILWLRLRRLREQRIAKRSGKLQRRLARIPSEALPGWAEQVLGETGRAFSAWRRSGEGVYLDEAGVGADALSAVLQQLREHEGER